MREIGELVEAIEPAFTLIRQWADNAEIPVEILPPSPESGKVLFALQVTTRSTVGSLAYETGGILVDDGWLRLLGSGHPKFERNLASWNAGKTDGFLLVADDVLGGFFAINGGALGSDQGAVYYLAPETLAWEALEIVFTTFVEWAFTAKLRDFYSQYRHAALNADAKALSCGQCLHFYPFLWTKEGSSVASARRPISIDEQWELNADRMRTLNKSHEDVG